MNHTEIMHFIAQAAINISEGVPGPIEVDSPIHKALIALCEEESRKQSFDVVCFPFTSEGHVRTATLGASSGPFASRAEAERACREALSTGRFYRVAIEERKP